MTWGILPVGQTRCDSRCRRVGVLLTYRPDDDVGRRLILGTRHGFLHLANRLARIRSHGTAWRVRLGGLGRNAQALVFTCDDGETPNIMFKRASIQLVGPRWFIEGLAGHLLEIAYLNEGLEDLKIAITRSSHRLTPSSSELAFALQSDEK